MNNQFGELQSLRVIKPQPLTLATRRLYHYLLIHALKKKTKNHLDYAIPLTKLAGVFGVSVPTVEQLDSALTDLMRTLIRVVYPDHAVTFPMLSEVSFNAKTKSLNYVYPKLAFSLFQHPVLLEQCLISAHFSHKYSVLIYELIAPAYYMKGQDSFQISVPDLRDLFEMEESKLTNFSDFSRFVLMPSVNEINLFSHFKINVERKNKGRKITDVIFHFSGEMRNKIMKDPLAVIPPMRPKLTLTAAQAELYADILNAPIRKREAAFRKAQAKAEKQGQVVDDATLDTPDVWLKFI